MFVSRFNQNTYFHTDVFRRSNDSPATCVDVESIGFQKRNLVMNGLRRSNDSPATCVDVESIGFQKPN